MSEKLNFRIAEWTSWAMGRVLDWINYLDVDLKDANLEDWKDRDVQRHELADEATQLETCDLCDEPAEYRQCQKCMNDNLVGSHTDEEYRQLEAEVTKWKTEANRLYGVGQDIEADRVELQRQVEKLTGELESLEGEVDV